jgi:hypothetical protein
MSRFLQHTLPRGFARVRTFGWLHPAAKNHCSPRPKSKRGIRRTNCRRKARPHRCPRVLAHRFVRVVRKRCDWWLAGELDSPCFIQNVRHDPVCTARFHSCKRRSGSPTGGLGRAAEFCAHFAALRSWRRSQDQENEGNRSSLAVCGRGPSPWDQSQNLRPTKTLRKAPPVVKTL